MTVKAREQFEKDKKAFKATFIVIVVLMLCYFPILIFRAVLIRYRTKISSELLYIYLFLATLMAFLNSLLNPVIYSFRLRQFRLAFIKLIFNSSELSRFRFTSLEHKTLPAGHAQEHEVLNRAWNKLVRTTMIMLSIMFCHSTSIEFCRLINQSKYSQIKYTHRNFL